MKIEKFSNSMLLKHFEDAVCDNNYSPSSDDYNKSGFTYIELKREILKRMDIDDIYDEDEEYI